jgi:hypothetical protein
MQCNEYVMSHGSTSTTTQRLGELTTDRDPKAEEIQRMVARAIPKAEKMARAAKAPKKPGTCTRCGRAGHYSPDCSALDD